jgi:hypothetical protein
MLHFMVTSTPPLQQQKYYVTDTCTNTVKVPDAELKHDFIPLKQTSISFTRTYKHTHVVGDENGSSLCERFYAWFLCSSPQFHHSN